MNGHEGWFPWGIGMWIFWILLTVVVVWLVRFVAGGRGGGASPPESALEILRQRYARGEISEEEFERRRKKLLEE